MPDMVLCMVSIMVRMRLHDRDHLRELGDQLRHDRIQLIHVFDEILQFVVNLVDTVECVEIWI